MKLVSCPDPPSKTPFSSWRVEGGCGYETKAKQEVNDSEHGQELSNYPLSLPWPVFTHAVLYTLDLRAGLLRSRWGQTRCHGQKHLTRGGI